MSIVVYWTNPAPADLSVQRVCSLHFTDAQLSEALTCTEEARAAGMSHVCISSELSSSVGKPGVDTVKDGKTPDGRPYVWSKQHRGSPLKDK